MKETIVIKNCKLQPISHVWTNSAGRKHTTTESILIYFDGYPTAIVHIDAFYQPKGNNKLYDLLYEDSETIEGEFEFTWENEDE